jgi:hypothetical protein
VQTKARADSARDSDHLPSLLLALLCCWLCCAVLLALLRLVRCDVIKDTMKYYTNAVEMLELAEECSVSAVCNVGRETDYAGV